jgi:hypothetical protein
MRLQQQIIVAQWPDVVVKSVEQEQPAVTMTADVAADLGRCCRGVEPMAL